MSLSVLVAPLLTPVRVEEAKLHLRLDTDEHDAYLEQLIAAATDYVELWCGRALLTQTLVYTRTGFPSAPMRLPRPPVQEVLSVEYLGVDGVLTTLDPAIYQPFLNALPPSVTLARGQAWPQTIGDPEDVRITYLAGYGDTPEEVPAALRQAICVLVADLYEHAEAQLERPVHANLTVQRLLWAYRLLEAY